MTDKNSGLLQKALRLSETGSPQPAEKRRGSVFVQHARLVDRDTDTPGAVLICGGKIAEVYTGDNLAAAEKAAQAARAAGIPVVDAQGKILTPAFTDLHAHFRDPGFPEKETLESGSRAAVAGGYTAAVLMANTDPVISSAGAAADIVRRAAQYGRLRVFQAVSLTAGFNGTDVSPLSVLQPQDVPLVSEDGRDVEQAAVMLDAMQACAAAGLMVSCHSEEASLGVRANRMRQAGDFRAAERLFRLAEEINTERNLLLAEEGQFKSRRFKGENVIVTYQGREAKEQFFYRKGAFYPYAAKSVVALNTGDLAYEEYAPLDAEGTEEVPHVVVYKDGNVTLDMTLISLR